MAVRAVAREWPWQLAGELQGGLRSLAYSEAGKRDLRLDLLRGLAVSVMVVDHIGGDTILTQLSGGNQFIVSAAEGFVFLSGLVLGMVYGERILRAGAEKAIRALLERTATLYRASVGLALTFLALFLMTDIRLWMDRAGGLGTNDPIAMVVGIATLHYAFHGSDVLVMYTLMLAVAPLIVYLLHRGHTPAVLLGSVALWALYQRYPEQATVPWTVLGSSFPVTAWQLLFVLGMVVGFHRETVAGWLLSGSHSSRLAILTAAGLVYLLSWSREAHDAVALPGSWFGEAAYGSLFYKVPLAPGRVLAFLGVAVLAYAFVSVLWVPLKYGLGWLLVPLGQNSLYVYIMHLFVVVLLYNLAPMFSWETPDTINLAAQVLGLGLLWIMVRSRFLFAVVPR